MSLETLPSLIALLIVLSVASERFVEILKGLSGFLDTTHTDDPRKERLRRMSLHILGVIAGVGIAALTWPILAQVLAETPEAAPKRDVGTILALGLLASGGSGFWNTMLSYAVNLKDLKRTEARERKTQLVSSDAPTPEEGQIRP